jgi:hypothetical protein
MSKLEKLDLMGVTLLAVVAAAVMAAWMVTTHDIAERHARKATTPQPVALTQDGGMKLTVTAQREGAPAPEASSATVTRTASVRASGGPSLEVALPFAFRP